MGNLQEELTRTENVALTSEDDVQKQIEHIKVTVISFLLHKKIVFIQKEIKRILNTLDQLELTKHTKITYKAMQTNSLTSAFYVMLSCAGPIQKMGTIAP